MDGDHTSTRPDETSSDATGTAGGIANQASGTARESGTPDEAASGGAVDATLRGDPGTPRAMGLGNESAPGLDDPETDLDAVGRPD